MDTYANFSQFKSASAELATQFHKIIPIVRIWISDTSSGNPPPPPPPPPENHLPLITSNGGGATASVSVAENTTAVTKVVATRFGYRTDAGLLDRAGRIRRWRRCIQVRHRCHDGRARL